MMQCDSRLIKRRHRRWPYALAFQTAVPSLDLAILKRAVGQRPLMVDSQAQEALGDFFETMERRYPCAAGRGILAVCRIALGEPVHQIFSGLQKDHNCPTRLRT